MLLPSVLLSYFDHPHPLQDSSLLTILNDVSALKPTVVVFVLEIQRIYYSSREETSIQFQICFQSKFQIENKRPRSS